MSDSDFANQQRGQPGREETGSALFANLVIQQTNMALMLLGRVPNPETGEPVQDLEAARIFIDTLEMLDKKTRGNLDPRETQLLKQSLTTLRMAFVEAVEAPSPETSSSAASPAPSQAAPSPSPADSTTTPDEEPRKKFSKKY